MVAAPAIFKAFACNHAYTCANQGRRNLDRIPNASDLTHDEMTSLRLIVLRSFMSKGSLPAERRARLIALGLIQDAMGGVAPTPAGRIAARG
jgi:hypothetical protein